MNTRVLELLQKPQLLAKEDLDLITFEIEKTPYIQSLRALYLMGVHQFFPEKYDQELSKTAAYTTDKKILYHLIHGNHKSIEPQNPLPNEEVQKDSELVDSTSEDEKITHQEEIQEIENLPHFTHSPIEVEILKQDELLLEEKTEEIHPEEEIQNEEISNESISEEVTSSEPVEDFIYAKRTNDSKEITEDKSQDAEVSETEKTSSDFQENIEIPFENPNPMDFYVKSTAKEMDSSLETSINVASENDPMDFYAQNPSIKKEEESETSLKTSEDSDEFIWKPMTLENSTVQPEEHSEMDFYATASEPAAQDRPVLNVSFFSSDIEKIEKEKSPEPINKAIERKETDLKSNVSSFINTWQNWLKMSDSNSSKNLIEKKAAIIDKFIENSPKISPVSGEVEITIKEKKDDISHLMTETLAQLYVEQKLYSKAVKAYEILQEKFPEKKEVFLEEIQKIKNR